VVKDIIKVPFNELKYIHHISDIQIRNLKRHKEYEEVFERLYDKISEHRDNALVYIGGDIAHSKTDMSPELVDQLSRLLSNLSDICPTVIITGNHDCNLNNLSRLDVLSPIVKNLKHPNLHYLKNTGVYKCADVSLVVWDIWDNQEDYIEAKDVEGDTKIVLFHGTVDRAQTDLGFKLPSDVHIDKFKGYDLGLLGDIHKRQFLNEEKTVAYCGSLVQQNHGESVGHGYLLWDVLKRKSKYIEVPNDYGYYTLDIDSGNVPNVDNLPKKARLRVRISNTDAVQLKKALTIIYRKYGIKEVVVSRTDRLGVDRVRGDRINIGDITNSDYQYDLIKDYLHRNYVLPEEILLKIKKINDELNSILPEEEVSRNVSWRLKVFEFDNLFSYGESNIVDFSKLNGIVGLFAPNATGKSSLLDALSFCLFDTTSRAFKASSILNNKRKKFSCRVNFEINGLNYYITRTGKKLNNEHVKVDVDFYMIDETGEKVSLNGDQRRTTNFNIRRVIGTYEDFILTTLSSQNNSTVFIDKTQKERKELLAQFMGIGVFDKLYTLAHEEIYEVSTLLKDFKKTNYSKELVEIDSEIDSFRIEYDSLIVVKNDLIEEDRQLSKDILEITKKLKPVDDAITDIEQLKIDKHTFKDELQNIEETITEIESKTEVNGLKEDELREKIESYTDDNINKKYLELQQNEQNKSDIKIEIDKLKIDVKHKLDKINTLGNLKYDSNCEYCMSNPFTLDAIKTKNELEVDKKLANEYVDKFDTLENEINHIQHIRDKKFDLDNSLETLQSIESQNLKYISLQTLMLEKKNNTIKQINLLEEKIIKYFTQEKDIKYNKELEDDIEDLKETIDNLVTLISEHEDKINTVHGTIKIGETKKQNIIDTINRVEKLEDKFKAYEYYLDAVKRDGVPYELITKALPTIEGEVNNILSQIVDFGIILEMDGKNINTHLVYDNDNLWPLELSSGMERFISSLAIRVGLINVSNLPRSNFLAIDEGWGTMDSDNLNSVYQLFQYLKSQFQFTLIVSHIDTMRDAVDSLVEITKYKNYSSIKYV